MSRATQHRWRFLRRGVAWARAFSLVEVIVALGIFSVGIAVTLRLFAGISESIRLTGETETGIRAAETLMGRLRARPFREVASGLITEEEFQGMDSGRRSGRATDRRLFFADPKAGRIGPDEDSVWIGHEKEKYFEIALVRDERLSPPAKDEQTACLVFTACIRWPASATVGAHQTMLSGSVFRGR